VEFIKMRIPRGRAWCPRVRAAILRDADTTRSGERPQLARILEGGGADLSPSHAVSVE
jgi:hypothetical protein